MADYFVKTAGGTPGSGAHLGTWAAATAYALGDVVVDPAVADHFVFECTAGGTSGAASPTFDKTVNNTTPDGAGTLVWTCRLPVSWALATTTLERGDGAVNRGDRLLLDSTLVDSYATTKTFTFGGTRSDCSEILSATAGSSPPTYASGATIKTTGANNIAFAGSLHAKGITLMAGNAAFTNADIVLVSGTASDGHQVWEECVLDISNGSSADLQIAQGSNNRSQSVTLINTTIRWRNVSSNFIVYGPLEMHGGGLDSAGSLLTLLMQVMQTTQDKPVKCYGVDFSRMSATGTIINGAASQSPFAEFHRCKFPATFTGTMATIAEYGRVSFYECMFGTTRRILYIRTLAGFITDETTVLKSGGASDGYDPVSWEMYCDFECDEFTNPLYTDWIPVFIAGTGSKTIEFDFVWDQVAVNELKNSEVWLEVDYMGTASSRLTTYATDKRADSFTTAMAQDSSSATWTGTSGFVNGVLKQKVGVTINVQEEGVVMCRVGLSSPFNTIYLDPKPTVT